MSEYPPDLISLLKGITEEPAVPAGRKPSGNGRVSLTGRASQSLFAQMVSSNPFSQEYRLVTTPANKCRAKLSLPQSKLLQQSEPEPAVPKNRCE